MDFSADCTILTAMISRVQSYEKLKKLSRDFDPSKMTHSVEAQIERPRILG